MDGRCSHCLFFPSFSSWHKLWCGKGVFWGAGGPDRGKESNAVQSMAVREGLCSALAFGAEDSEVCDVGWLCGDLL